MKFSPVTCTFCGKIFLKDNRHINENRKFNHKFYCSRICERLYKNKQVELTCERPGCKNKFKRIQSALSPHNFCSRSCFVTVNNRGRKKEPILCKVCKLPTSGRTPYCSVKCWAKTRRLSKEKLIEEIKNLAQILRRVPTKREFKHIDTCFRQFGSWNNALIEAGFEPNRSLNQRMYKRRVCKASDGHVCSSISELIIDNWFSAVGIRHTKDSLYPVGKFLADWRLSKNVLVEYFGLANDSKRYDNDIKRKRRICKERGISLIEIYSRDLYPQNKLTEIFNTESKTEKQTLKI